jgi:ATP-dependent DNA helicase RecQ
MEAAAVLRDVFGFDGFRPGQEAIVDAVTQGRDVLAIMPTGGGKSLCFQLPALLRPGLTVVISPLIALMRDQVRALRAAGVAAYALSSGHTDDEQAEAREALADRRAKLIYLAPERLAGGGIVPLLRRAGASLIAVDEAHCVSQWGHDFRPDYLRIGDLRRDLGVPLAAFTTADAETRAEIIAKLFPLKAPDLFLHGFDRPNIHLAFAAKDSPRDQILAFARARRGQSGIVYAGARAKTEVLAKALSDAGLPAIPYHAGMDPDARRVAEHRFQQDDGLIVVATVAFGMGIDKPDIRWVAHADLPKSVESYYQEIGRAGRDGLPAETLTLFGPDDIRFRRQQIDEGAAPDDRKMADHGRLNALLGLAEALGCRRQRLLAYFGEDSDPCGHCDLCDRPPSLFDATEPVRMALSAALRTGESFGAGHLTDVLMGVATDKVVDRGHHLLPTFGIGKGRSRAEWTAILRQMLGQDLLRPDPTRMGALRLTPVARPVLKGEVPVTMRADRMAPTREGPRLKVLVGEDDQPLLSALKAKRRALAEAANVPAYVIFADKTLIEMAETRPMTLDAMARIHGVGAKKLESFGRAFLEVITGAATDTHPARRKLAVSGDGDLFERLQAVEMGLIRGPDGAGKPMRLSTGALAKVAAERPRDRAGLERLIGARHADRFGDAFLAVLLEQA